MINKMANNWVIRVVVRRMIGLLPASIAFPFHKKLIQIVQAKHSLRIDTEVRVKEGIKNISLINRKTGFVFQDNTILELGTGWHGIDLILFYILGAKEIITIDHYRHLAYENIVSQIQKIERGECLKELADLEFVSQINKRWDRLKEGYHLCSTLDELLDLLNVKYYISKSCIPIGLNILPGSIDLFYTESVLQRIPEDDLILNISYIGRNLMSEEAVFFYSIHQNDINQAHVQKGQWRLKYLRYSDFFFNTFLTGPLNSQNRLRESDFINIINNSNMIILYLESHLSNKDVEKLRAFKIAKRFHSKTLQDLAVVHSKIVGKCNLTTKREKKPMKKKLVYLNN